MKYVDEYRDPALCQRIVAKIKTVVTKPWVLMEVCGGQTHAIMRYGLSELLPDGVELIHGPGCPVCVTPITVIDHAIALAQRHDVILASFGDMLRVPGSSSDLNRAKAQGGDVRVVYSPVDAVHLAQKSPDKEVVFFGVGFETTAPANALAVLTAERHGVKNFSLLAAHVRVPPALEAILQEKEQRVQGFLAAGHVCTVMGWREYLPIAERYGVPIVITGFEPVDILQGVLMCLQQLEEGRSEVENPYARVVDEAGNTHAQMMIERVFEPKTRPWRGLGEVPQGGLVMRDAFGFYDACQRFGLIDTSPLGWDSRCKSGRVLQGLLRPDACPSFGKDCTPDTPLGAPMVSSEGACSAYYRFQSH